MEVIKSILTNNPCYLNSKKINVKGLMLHSVGCPQPSAEVFVKNWNSTAAGRACVHAFIDGRSGSVYQTLPWEHRGWHCGGSGNNTHIGIEMCEPSCMKYTSGSQFVCSDLKAAVEVAERTYESAVKLFAYLCGVYKLNPLLDGVILSHSEGHKRGIASGHGDPEHLWNQLGTEYTMEGFRNAVKQEMDICTVREDPGTSFRQSCSRISENGLNLIAGFEGLRLKAYKCPAGVWTIGYGHTEGVREGDILPSEKEAKELLKKDIEKYEGYVRACIQKGTIYFAVNQNQFDALTSFAYNCGAGNLKTLVAGRDAKTVADKLLLYNKGGGRLLQGLVRRREEERRLFLLE